MSYILNYKGFEGNGEWSEDDHVFHGKIQGITDIVTYEGEDYETLKEEFCIAVDDWQQTRRGYN